MASLWLLVIIIAVSFVLFVGTCSNLQAPSFLGPRLISRTAWLILSSCLGDNFRLRFSNVNPRQALYDRSYMRAVTSNGIGAWNQFEMVDMLGDSPRTSIDSNER
jgi:hypothetical protein